jgi:hypothetical protein
VTLSHVAPTIFDLFPLAKTLPHTNLKVKYLENDIFWKCGLVKIYDLINMIFQFIKTKSQKQHVAHQVRKHSLIFPLIYLTSSTWTSVTSLVYLLELADRHQKHPPTSQPPSLKWHGRTDCCPLSESILLERNTLSPGLIAPPGMQLVEIRHKEKLDKELGYHVVEILTTFDRNWMRNSQGRNYY